MGSATELLISEGTSLITQLRKDIQAHKDAIQKLEFAIKRIEMINDELYKSVKHQ